MDAGEHNHLHGDDGGAPGHGGGTGGDAEPPAPGTRRQLRGHAHCSDPNQEASLVCVEYQ